jgi:hypothetical protein
MISHLYRESLALKPSARRERPSVLDLKFARGRGLVSSELQIRKSTLET